MPIDLTEALTQLREGRCDARTLLSHSLERARSPACERVFIRTFFDEATAVAAHVDARLARGEALPALGGLSLSVKDLFDVAGHPTTAASASLADAVPADDDAPAVARLRAAGAALIGHTNLSEFAFSGVGLNPHHGTPVNPVTRLLDGLDRIPGGSTSGGAVSVSTGAAWAALGTDTGGSLRIPAALQGLVGFKSTARCIPLDRCIPLSPSLDTAGAITRSVRDAALLHGLLSGQTVKPDRRPLAQRRLAVVQELMQDDLEPAVAQAFERALSVLRAAGAQIEVCSIPALTRVAELQAGGGLPAFESWQWHRDRLATRGALYDPRVALRIRRGETILPDHYHALLDARRRWIHDMTLALNGYDAVLSPTVPTQAPEIAPLLLSDGLFFATNARLLRNPSVVNLLDGCALSLPCHRPDELPMGLMLWAPGLQDATLLSTAADVEAALTPIAEAH
ncbi:amidase [Roseateles amylovorans]|uniref:Amidase n=1 Tax=Roseateles amylovorans TaxID=2978473 RepID=A0ABY6AV21_9BURK|nr:amidase [Roseateles amylovorans]UXH77051.1 amidase [Roseateles amylovorans]